MRFGKKNVSIPDVLDQDVVVLLRLRPVRFMAVGGVTTVIYLVVYVIVFGWLGGQPANALALVLTADANTLANRRFTFRLPGWGSWQDRAKGGLAFLVTLLMTSAALWLLDLSGRHGRTTEMVVLLAANLAGGLAHFLLLRGWAFTAIRFVPA